jgi:UDP-N-acetylmuramoyl-tripeptide--D-alanyl-D-alanine ligase
MSAKLWTAKDAAAATGGQSTARWAATGISIDSRSLEPGDLFVALKGPAFDGHDYIAQALDKGAVAALAHRRPAGLAEDAPLLLVEDTLAALTALGAAARARTSAKIIGVTGSVGKTGTKEALRACLSAQAPTSASLSSLNNHWGLPLSLARMPAKTTYGVFELGMNHPGEIRTLSQLLRPDVAIITNVEAAHIAFFDSVAEIAEAKAEIFEGMAPGGVAVLNRDNPLFIVLVERAEQAGLTDIIPFGRHPEAEARLVACDLRDAGSSVTADIRGHEISFDLSLPGAHWVMNSLAVLAGVSAIGADLEPAAEQLARLMPLRGRGERHQVPIDDGDFLLIDDSYNANPTSMKSAFAVLARCEPGPGGRRIAVLGDMLELGDEARALHARLAVALEAAGIDLAFTCGPHMAALHQALPTGLRGGHAADSHVLAPLVAEALRAGDTVLVKGSLGSRMAVLVSALTDAGPSAAEPGLARAANGE